MDDTTPKTLREKALDYVERLINGDDADGSPLRLEAARLVIENYWSFDHENDGDIDLTAGARKLNVEMWNNAAPEQLKVKQPYTAPALTEFGEKCPIEPKPREFRVAACAKCRGICEDTIEGLCRECSQRKKAYNYAFWNDIPIPKTVQPMTLGRAVEVLNEHKYGDQEFPWSTIFGDVKSAGSDDTFTYFEAIAIAEKLEREK